MAVPGCYRHPDVAAQATCSHCLKPICGVCLLFLSHHELCPDCLPLERAARSRRRAVAAAVAICLVVFGAWVVVRAVRGTLPGVAGAGAPGATFDYGKRKARIDELRGKLAAEPCDRNAIVDYGDTLVAAGDSRGALTTCAAFFQKCGEYPRLLWVTYSAHRDLSEFDAAAAVATQLIDLDPGDKDYWDWRGLAFESKGDLERAVADFRQAIAIEPDLERIPLNLASDYDRLGNPCEALFALEQYASVYPELQADGSLRARIDHLDTTKCALLAGVGHARVRFRPNSSAITADVEFNGTHRGRLAIDTGASFVVLSKAFAATLGIDPPAGRSEVTVATAAGLRRVRLAVADSVAVQGARASRVEVAVADDLRGSLDGLLGLSFLERFVVSLDAERGELRLESRPKQEPTPRHRSH